MTTDIIIINVSERREDSAASRWRGARSRRMASAEADAATGFSKDDGFFRNVFDGGTDRSFSLETRFSCR